MYDSTVDEIGLCISEAEWYIANLSRLMGRKKVIIIFPLPSRYSIP